MQIEARRGSASSQSPPKLTFDEWLNKWHKRFGEYPCGYDSTRPRDFLCMGITPDQLEIVWNAAQENA